MSRTSTRSRSTKETRIELRLDLDGDGTTNVSTGLPFFDHMLDQLGRHGGLDLSVKAEGDLEVDAHHTVEDTGIVLGEAFREALGDKAGVRRFASIAVPLDEAAVEVVLDLSGRSMASCDPITAVTACSSFRAGASTMGRSGACSIARLRSPS
ncbi:MAG: hypothetical protein F4108_01470 [Acidimicrobiaceae bacterium]|nr:hypothetical protein [Acidimicrobiaceae bacterium]